MKRRISIALVLVAGFTASGCDAMPDFVLETLKTSTKSAVEMAMQDAIGGMVEGTLGGILDGQLPFDDPGALDLDSAALGGFGVDGGGMVESMIDGSMLDDLQFDVEDDESP